MADAADDRPRQGVDRAHDALVVERPQILQRTAAAADEHRVDLVAPLHLGQRGDQCRRRIRALHQARVDDHLHMRGAPGERGHHVVQRRAGGGRDHADGAHERRQRPLASGVEQAFGREARAQPQELLVQLSRAEPLHGLDDHLQLAARLVHREPAAQLHLQAVLQRHVAENGRALEHGATQRTGAARSVLEREIAMAAGGARGAAQLAPHRHGAEAGGQRIARGQQQRRDAPRGRPGRHGRNAPGTGRRTESGDHERIGHQHASLAQNDGTNPSTPQFRGV